VSELEWRGGLSEAEIDAVRALAAAATEVDGVAPLSEHVLRHLGPSRAGSDEAGSDEAGNNEAGGGEAVHLLGHDGATLVGVAHLDLEKGTGGSGELTVHPDHRRAGLGTLMVRELRSAVPPDATMQLWAHGDHPAAAAIAARLGFRKIRELRQLRLDLPEPPAVPEPPDGVLIRSFRVGVDEAEFLRVNNAAFGWHPEQGGWDLSDITLRERESWFDPDGFLLAVDSSDRLLGYHWTKVHPAAAGAEPLGEVYVLGVDPSAQGLHLGRTLTLAGLRYLHDRGLRTMTLYVEADNEAAVRLYGDLGFTRWHTDVMYAG
jgi:mycothiol synthase